EDENVDPGWKARLSTTVIEVDQKSIVTNLRQWLNSDDPQIWKPAAEIIPQISGDDVQKMVADLIKRNSLSAKKQESQRTKNDRQQLLQSCVLVNKKDYQNALPLIIPLYQKLPYHVEKYYAED